MIRHLVSTLLASVLLVIVPMGAGLSAATAATDEPVKVASPHAKPSTSACSGAAEFLCDQVDKWLAKNPDKAKKVGEAPGVKQIGALGEAVGKLGDAARKLAKFSPDDITEMWAKKAGQMAVGMMGKIADWQKDVSEPGWNAQWWTKQYALMAGLGFIVFAFILVVVTAKIARPGGEDPISGITLLRSAGVRLWLVPVVIVMAPALLMELFGVTSGLADIFARQATGSAGGALDAGMDAVGSMHDTMSNVGGALGAIIMAGMIGIAGFIVLGLLMLATWGLNVLSLFVPVVLAMYVYPPWRPAAKKLAGIIIGLLLIPTLVNIIYYVFWAASEDAITGDSGDGLGVVLFMVVGAVMMAMAPVIAAWLIPLVVPGGGAMAGSLGGGAVGGMAGSMLGGAGSRMVGSGPARADRLAGHWRNRPSPAEPAAPGGGPGAPSGGSGRQSPSSPSISSSKRGRGQHAAPGTGDQHQADGDSEQLSSPAAGGAASRQRTGAGQATRRGGRAAVGAGRRAKNSVTASTRDLVDRNPLDWSEDS